MPYKHQTESYRVIGGRRWESWGDFNAEEALAEKGRLINQGWQVRKVKLDDGMYRIFRWKTQ